MLEAILLLLGLGAVALVLIAFWGLHKPGIRHPRPARMFNYPIRRFQKDDR